LRSDRVSQAGQKGRRAPDEIARLDGRTDLTVLAAGSRGVVATLWDVDAATTAVFMQQLYDRLGRGDPPAEALRRAKQRLRADPRWNRPSLWAGYVLIGEPPPVAPARTVWIWVMGMGVVILAGWGVWRMGKLRITRE
jgi:hypothetical protein